MTLELITRTDLKPVIEELSRLSKISEYLLQAEDCKVYNNDDLAKLLKVSKRTIQNWRNEGLIDFIQIGSKIYYTAAAVQLMLDENKKLGFRTIAKRNNHG